jgi:hypothetical protein
MQTLGRLLENIIRHAGIGTRQAIEDVIDWNFRIFAARFAAGLRTRDHALHLPKSCSIDQHDVLLFGIGVEEVAVES